MNSHGKAPSAKRPVPIAPAVGGRDEVDATLRLLATLTPPVGLEDRVFAGVLAASHRGRVLQWPAPLPVRDWMRSAAAAAIVLAIGGGGWGIYSLVQHQEPARAIAAPRVVMQPGGFSSAGAIRRPQTLDGPVVKQEAESSQLKNNHSLKPKKTNESSLPTSKPGTGLTKNAGDKSRPTMQLNTTDTK